MSYPPSGPFRQAINRIPLMKVAYRIALFIRNFMVDDEKISAGTVLKKQEKVFDDFAFSESFEIIMLLFMLSRYDYLEHIDRHKGYLVTDKLLNDFPLLDDWMDENPSYDLLIDDINAKEKKLEIFFRRRTWIDKNKFLSLDLGDLLITSLDEAIFDPFPDLQALYLNDNLLYTLPGDIFHALPDLETLNLSRNMISQLPIHIFSNNDKLKSLDLTNNGIDNRWLTKFRALNRLSHGILEIKI